jgi:hypothetical protein
MPQSHNRLLASLPQNLFAAMEPQLERVALAFGDVIAEIGESIRKVYFPYSGVVSLVVQLQVGGRSPHVPVAAAHT